MGIWSGRVGELRKRNEKRSLGENGIKSGRWGEKQNENWLLGKDGIKNYLELDDNIRNKSNIAFIGKSIYILHFPGSEKVAVSYGIIKEENKNYDFNHLCCTGNGSSGSPIIDLSNNKVIGIHKMASKRFDYNIGLFIKYAINEFNKQNYNNNYNEIKTGIKIEDEDKKDEIYLKSELRIKKPTITQLLNQRFSCEILLNLLSSGERCVFHAHPDRKYRFYTPLKKNIKNFTQDDLELEFINRVNYFQAHFIDVSEHGEFRYPDNLSKKEIEDDIHKWGYYASLGRRDILYNAYEKLLKLLEGDKASLEIPLKNDKNSNKINKDFFSGVNKNEIEKIFKDGTIESITSFELEDNAKKDYEKGDYSIKAKLYLDPPKNKSI
mgnify:CR=1 FL=1